LKALGFCDERIFQEPQVSGEVFGAMVIVSIATSVLAPLALKPLLQHWPQADQG
jgi:hypothetical protein